MIKSKDKISRMFLATMSQEEIDNVMVSNGYQDLTKIDPEVLQCEFEGAVLEHIKKIQRQEDEERARTSDFDWNCVPDPPEAFEKR